MKHAQSTCTIQDLVQNHKHKPTKKQKINKLKNKKKTRNSTNTNNVNKRSSIKWSTHEARRDYSKEHYKKYEQYDKLR